MDEFLANINVLSWITFTPLIGMAVVLCLPRTAGELVKRLTLLFTGIPLVLASMMWCVFERGTSAMQFTEDMPWIAAWNVRYTLGIDGLSLALVWLTCLLLFIATISSWKTTKGVKGYFALLMLLEVGINGVFVSIDFFLFYVFWEVMLLPMYFLIGIWGGERREYAAIKFFLYTLAGSVLMLVAMVGLYLASSDPVTGEHTFNILTWQTQAAAGQLTGYDLFGMPFQTWVFVFLFIGFAIKVPVFPFHTWLPDAHVEAPTAISVILAGILLKLGAYGMFRINFPVAPEAFHQFIPMIALLGVINIVYGAAVAMAQTDFKRMVAYSSVSHMGYVLLGAAAATEWGWTGANFQLIAHGTSSAMCFLVVGVLYDRAHHRRINGFGGIGMVMPVYFGLTTIGFFASLGLPGFSGFVAEAVTLWGAFDAFPTYVAISVVGIVITAAFYLWTMQRVFLGPTNEDYADLPDITPRETLCQAPLAFLCLVLGIFPFLLLDVMQPSIKHTLDLVVGAGG